MYIHAYRMGLMVKVKDIKNIRDIYVIFKLICMKEHLGGAAVNKMRYERHCNISVFTSRLH